MSYELWAERLVVFLLKFDSYFLAISFLFFLRTIVRRAYSLVDEFLTIAYIPIVKECLMPYQTDVV